MSYTELEINLLNKIVNYYCHSSVKKGVGKKSIALINTGIYSKTTGTKAAQFTKMALTLIWG